MIEDAKGINAVYRANPAAVAALIEKAAGAITDVAKHDPPLRN